MPEEYSSLDFHIDHIIAKKHGGRTEMSNLAWSCFACNSFKGSNISGIDPATGNLVRLFHPRNDDWILHFTFDGPVIVGKTEVGRGTIQALRLNDLHATEVRLELMEEDLF